MRCSYRAKPARPGRGAPAATTSGRVKQPDSQPAAPDSTLCKVSMRRRGLEPPPGYPGPGPQPGRPAVISVRSSIPSDASAFPDERDAKDGMDVVANVATTLDHRSRAYVKHGLDVQRPRSSPECDRVARDLAREPPRRPGGCCARESSRDRCRASGGATWASTRASRPPCPPARQERRPRAALDGDEEHERGDASGGHRRTGGIKPASASISA